MIKKMRTRVADAGRQAARTGTAPSSSSVGARIRGLWRQHRDRVTNDRDYATALGAAAAAVAALFTQDPALLAVVAAVARCMSRSTTPPTPSPGDAPTTPMTALTAPGAHLRTRGQDPSPRWDDGIA